jgi:hypothetical protein
LRILNFEMTVGQPHKHLLVLNKMFLTSHQRESNDTIAASLKNRNKEAGQYAWNLVNDSIGSYVHVRFDAREIATAALFLAMSAHGVPLDPAPVSGTVWHAVYACNLDHIDEIGNAMLNNFDPVMQNGHGVKPEREYS